MSGRSRDQGRRRSRSRSRSRSRGRDARGSSPRGGGGDGGRGGGGGMSDVTSDPNTVGARIFVGSIDSSMTRESLQEYFSQYGRVVGVAITRNKFGFVQFSRDEEATACLANGPSAYVEGNRIDIKPAKIGSGPGPMPGERRDGGGGGRGGRDGGRGGGGGGGGGREDFGRDRSPMRGGRGDDYYGRDYPYPPGGPPMDRDGRGRFDDRFDDYYREQYPDRYADYYRQDDPRGPAGPRVDDPRAPGPQAAPTAAPSAVPPEPMDPMDPTRPNDVEIVVPNKMQRGYAENVEGQLKRMNMLVDLLFPPPDIPPSQVLSDLTSRKCLYAIFITEDNEQHRSLTLSILHTDAQQEHRNMPVDDALRLVEQNFGDYVKKIRQKNMREVVPRDIRNLMLDLLEIRPLSMGDLDKMIKFLKERQSLLVDDQIQQKRESQAGVGGSGPLAVTYPGLPYGNSGVVGAAASGATATSLPLAAATSYGSTATAVATGAYSAYGGMGAAALQQQTPQSTAYGSYGMTAAGSSQVAPVAPPTMAAAANNKEQSAALSERIYNIMKGAGGGSGVPTGVPPPSGVQAPKGVPAPSGVPPPSMVPPVNWSSQQQSGQQSANNFANSAYGNNYSGTSNSGSRFSDAKPSGGQQNSGLFAAYTPWSQ